MTYILLLIGILLVVGLLGVVFTARKHSTSVTEEITGVCAVAIERKSQKQQNKARILELFNQTDELTNTDIRQQLGVSRRSVVRYMNELETEGAIRQIGETGRSVVYART